MLIGGHRGLPTHFPDNSIEGIIAARESCDYVEIDVRRTSDGTMVLSHDPDIDGRVIADHQWHALADLELGQGLHPTTLESVMGAIGPFPLDIEVKNSPLEPGFDPSGEFAVEVAQLARRADVVTSFWWPTVDAVRRTHPQVRTGLLIDENGHMKEAARHAEAREHPVLAPHWTLLLADEALTRSLVLEFEIAAWTVDDVDVAEALRDLGIDSIITNDPVGIRAALRE